MQSLWDIPVDELLHVRASHAPHLAAHRLVRDGFDLWRMPGRKRLALRSTGLVVTADVATRRLQMALADDLADGAVYACTVPFGPQLRGQLANF